MTYRLRHPAVVLAAFTVLAFFWCSTAFAQFETRPVHRSFYWVNLGVGGTGFGGAYGLGLTGQFGLHLFSFHCATAYNVESSEVGTEFSVLYGIGKRGEKGAFSIAVGAGRVEGNRHHGDYLYDFEPVLGFSAETQVFGRIGKNAGMGLSVLLNLNKEKNLPVILLCVQFGKLWPKRES